MSNQKETIKKMLENNPVEESHISEVVDSLSRLYDATTRFSLVWNKLTNEQRGRILQNTNFRSDTYHNIQVLDKFLPEIITDIEEEFSSTNENKEDLKEKINKNSS